MTGPKKLKKYHFENTSGRIKIVKYGSVEGKKNMERLTIRLTRIN